MAMLAMCPLPNSRCLSQKLGRQRLEVVELGLVVHFRDVSRKEPTTRLAPKRAK